VTPSVTVISTGHQATDHRIFDKEARTLAAAGFDVCVIAAHPAEERRDGVEIVPLGAPGGRLDRFLLRPWRALRLIRRRRGDVVHIHDAELLQICPPLRLLGRPVVVYDVHEDFANLMRRRDWLPGPVRALVQAAVKASESLLARSVDAIVAATATLAGNFPHQRRIALYNLPSRAFVDRARRDAPAPSARSVDVLHVGVLSEERLRFLVTVLRALLERRPATSVRVVGLPPSQAEALRDALRSDALDLRGRVPYDDMPGLVADCRVGVNVHPILYPHLRVAVPVKVFEYMAAGCGVVTSWLPELHGLLTAETKAQISTLRDADPADYADAIAAWLDDPERLDAASEHLKAAARDVYSWDSQSPKLIGLYEDLLAARAAA
jgi:glycosyltransferase involved in cell wall biosynthesis